MQRHAFRGNAFRGKPSTASTTTLPVAMTLGLALRPQLHPSSCTLSTGTRPRCSPRPVARAMLCHVFLSLLAGADPRTEQRGELRLRPGLQHLWTGRRIAMLLCCRTRRSGWLHGIWLPLVCISCHALLNALQCSLGVQIHL